MVTSVKIEQSKTLTYENTDTFVYTLDKTPEPGNLLFVCLSRPGTAGFDALTHPGVDWTFFTSDNFPTSVYRTSVWYTRATRDFTRELTFTFTSAAAGGTVHVIELSGVPVGTVGGSLGLVNTQETLIRLPSLTVNEPFEYSLAFINVELASGATTFTPANNFTIQDQVTDPAGATRTFVLTRESPKSIATSTPGLNVDVASFFTGVEFLLTVDPACEEVFAPKKDHKEQGLGRLLYQFREAENLKKFLCTYLEQIQDVENNSFKILDNFDLDCAAGAQLEILGRIANETRDGQNDEDFRIRIRTKIRANISNGTIEDLIAVALQSFPDATVSISEAFPASATIALDNIDITELQASQLKRFLVLASPAGVELFYLYIPVNAFRFDTPGQGMDQGIFASLI